MEIKNCHICKNPPEVVPLDTGWFRVQCPICLLEYYQTTWAHETEEKAITMWNQMITL
jgi:hypothetical protein